MLDVIHAAVTSECERNQQRRLALLPLREMQRRTSVPDVSTHSAAIGADVVTRSAAMPSVRARRAIAVPAGRTSFTSDAAP